MKLKLEQQDPVTILTVSEDVTFETIPVLKAGLSKLFKSGKEAILLDMSSVSLADLKPATVAAEIAALPGWANEEGFDLLIASRLPEISTISDRAKALEIFASPIADLLLEEASLQTTVKDLQRKKSALEDRLKSLKTDEAKIKKLQAQKSKNLLLIDVLSRQVKKFAGHRTESLFMKTDTHAKLAKVIIPILVDQKLPVKKAAT